VIRVKNWESRLESYLLENRKRPFKYGSWDCALFVCGAIEAMTGNDPAAWFRGRYTSRAEARELMREKTGTANFYHFFESMAAEFHMPEVAMTLAHRGDMVLVETGGACSLGIVGLDGQRIILAGETRAGVQGLGFVGLDRGVRAWRV